MSDRVEVLAGCGSEWSKKLAAPGREEWNGLVTLDFNAAHKPDIVHDLTVLPYPFADSSVDEIHFYDVLEHLAQQGDFRTFFAQFSEFWRFLKPGGMIFGISPGPASPWLWGDPGHTRVVGPECLTFLSQAQYVAQVGKTPMTDYRFCYSADFDLVYSELADGSRQHRYALAAVKPSRCPNE